MAHENSNRIHVLEAFMQAGDSENRSLEGRAWVPGCCVVAADVATVITENAPSFRISLSLSEASVMSLIQQALAIPVGGSPAPPTPLAPRHTAPIGQVFCPARPTARPVRPPAHSVGQPSHFASAGPWLDPCLPLPPPPPLPAMTNPGSLSACGADATAA